MFIKPKILILNIGKLRFQIRNFSYSNPLAHIRKQNEKYNNTFTIKLTND